MPGFVEDEPIGGTCWSSAGWDTGLRRPVSQLAVVISDSRQQEMNLHQTAIKLLKANKRSQVTVGSRYRSDGACILPKVSLPAIQSIGIADVRLQHPRNSNDSAGLIGSHASLFAMGMLNTNVLRL